MKSMLLLLYLYFLKSVDLIKSFTATFVIKYRFFEMSVGKKEINGSVARSEIIG